MPATLYRSGVTNAADRGLDIVTNYGPVVQIKHLSLDASLAEDIVGSVAINNIVIVCKTAEATIIQSLLNQVGLGIRGIVTQSDLETWYALCQTKYTDQLGQPLLNYLQHEFRQEFPMLNHFKVFLAERGYDASNLQKPFDI